MRMMSSLYSLTAAERHLCCKIDCNASHEHSLALLWHVCNSGQNQHSNIECTALIHHALLREALPDTVHHYLGIPRNLYYNIRLQMPDGAP